jgi:hypothetical protein
MKESVPREERVIVKKGNLAPGADWGKGQVLRASRDVVDVAGVNFEPVEELFVRWWLEVSEGIWDKERFWERESIVEVLESVVLLRLAIGEWVDFLRIEDGAFEPETLVDVEEVVECLCATGGGGGGIELSELGCEDFSFSLSLCPRCGK